MDIGLEIKLLILVRQCLLRKWLWKNSTIIACLFAKRTMKLPSHRAWLNRSPPQLTLGQVANDKHRHVTATNDYTVRNGNLSVTQE
jgi:hypothetical protein